ncbi:MAG: class I SAM-dependent rRNA methyltransferase [Clostridiales bacterium]|nr:class I SAM-dependent rRNA methyltransferase [Clostridiales bacterium]
MKTERDFSRVILTERGSRRRASRHPWVYDNEIASVEGDYQNGDIADVITSGGKYAGSGFINDRSKIRVRIISDNANETFDEAFWERRIGYALDYRDTVMGKDTGDTLCCRLIFGEADEFPGLTVDRFNDILVTQVLSLGTELRKDVIYRSLYKAMRERGADIKGIYERNDVNIRLLEGMEEYKGWYEGDGIPVPGSPVTSINENGIIYDVDVENGQKTGFFLDQKYNRKAISKIAKGKKVLDCFTHTGSFALNAAKGGASHVHAVDVSETAISMARNNAEKNGLTDIMSFEAADVFDLLPTISKGEYDFIILDPPAFTKSRKTKSNAERGYKEINYRAMKLLRRGGYLATCSCSHFMDEESFIRMLDSAARDAGVRIKQIEKRQQSPDHPILHSVPETDYLKFFILQIF